MINKTYPLTTSAGYTLDHQEPTMGSVVLVGGEYGTAFQRHFSDGKWHRTGGGRPKSWAFMLNQRNLVLVYEPAERRQ